MSLLYKRIHELESELALSLAHNLAVDKTGNAKATKSLLSELSTLIDTTIRGNIISESRIDNVITVNGIDRSIAASDGSSIIVYVTTGAADRTITILTESLIAGVKIKIVKVDSGAGHIIVATEGAEKIYNQYTGFDTIEIWLQFAFIEIESDNTQWIKVNSPYLHMLKEADRTSGSFDINVNPTTVPSWTLANLSALVPTGTLGLYGFYRIRNTDEEGVLLLRSAESVVTDEFAAITFVGKGGVVDRNGSPIIIRAKNGQFDYAEQGATTEIAIFSFQLWGWLL